MRICYFGWSDSVHVRRLARWFAKGDNEVHLVSDKPGNIEGVRVHVIPSKHKYDYRPRLERFKDWSFHDTRLYFLRTIKWSRNLMRDIKPDIVHCQTLLYPGYLGAFAGFRPYLITPFNGDILWRKEYGKLRVGRRLALWRAAYITADTEIILQRCFRLGVKKNRALRILLGIDLQKYKPVRDRHLIKRKLGIEGKYIVLNPRGLGREYNPETVIRTIPMVKNIIPDVKFIFTNNSSPDRIELLKNMAAQLGVKESLKFMGFQPWDLMVLYYQLADVMVSIATSDHSPSSMREAMACGAVPVMSDFPGVREWISNGENGLLVDPQEADGVASAITELLTDTEKRKKMSQKAVETIQTHGDQEMWWRRLEELYLHLNHLKNL